MSDFATRLTDFSDRLNPVLVREVKQALRGRFFVIVFALTLIFAMVASVGVLILSEESYGQGAALFSSCSNFLSFAACFLVPIGAFQSLGAEHDDQTRDLLVLSNLSPGQIIRGKFFTFLLLALLFAISLAPFFALSALLEGVDLLEIATTLTLTLVACIGYLIFSICLSSLAPSRGMRVLMMLGMIFFMFGMGTTMLTAAFATRTGGVSADQIIGAAFFVVIFGSFAYTLACTRFTHAEENRSTPLRLHISVLVFVTNFVWILFGGIGSGSFAIQPPSAWRLDVGMFLTSLAVFSVAALFFAAEPSSLSRYVGARVPKSRVAALLSFPFLPGGGKAVAWYLVNTAAYLGLVLVVVGGEVSGARGEPLLAGCFAICATLVFFLLPSGLFRRLTRKATSRRWLIFVPLLILMVSTFLTELFRATVSSGGPSNIWRIGSPFGIVGEMVEGGNYGMTTVLIAYGSLAAVSILINSVRMFSEARELLAASRHRSGAPIVTA